MTVSYSQTAELTCPKCGQLFNAEIWLVVAVDERLDLLDSVRAGTLHNITCPHCGYQGQVDAPLLIYQSEKGPHLIFSPAENTTKEQDVEQEAKLLDLLRINLGAAWQDAWLQQVTTTPRSLLSALLSDDPEVALQKIAEQAGAELEQLQETSPETYQALAEAVAKLAAQREETAEKFVDRANEVDDGDIDITASRQIPSQTTIHALIQVIQQFIFARTWADSQRFVEAHPELLRSATDALLNQLIATARVQGDQDAIRHLEEHRTLLRRCREVGIERAFAEQEERAGHDHLA